MNRFLMAVVLVSLILPASASAEPNMDPGQWEITTETHMKGMTIPSSTITQCLTEDDVVPRNIQPGQECEIIDVSTSGDTVRWTMRCTGQGGDVESSGRIQYFGDRFEGTITTTIGSTGMTMESTLTGTRLGDCN